jgi:hypothetical protein
LNSVDGEETEGVDGELIERVLRVLLLVAHSFPLFLRGGALQDGGFGICGRLLTFGTVY